MTEDSTETVYRSREHGPLAVVLRVTNRPARPAQFRLFEGSCVCGAAPDADLVIADSTVSRKHLELTLVPEGVRVRDLSSHNGTWYVGHRIKDGVLAVGSTLQLGSAELRIEADPRALDQPGLEADGYGELVGASPAMQKLYGLLSRIQSSLANVVIEGESGTGKELIARAIHRHSSVSSGPFVALNCASLESSLVRSELFGHKRGAFTGAIENRTGAFEAASGGTLFLDEIAELPPDVQPMLLRALEIGAITRVGENVERPVSVRVVAATHRGLGEEVRSGEFREDLYYRLMVIRVAVPALRDRKSDIPAIAAHFAQKFGAGELPPAIVAQLVARPFRGNVRELKNAVQSYCVLGELPPAEPVRDERLADWLRRHIDVSVPYAQQKDRLLKEFQRTYLELLLTHTGGNKSLAARISGLERSYLHKALNQLVPGSSDEPERD
jgi:DNA-binding NtrC family response regulator